MPEWFPWIQVISSLIVFPFFGVLWWTFKRALDKRSEVERQTLEKLGDLDRGLSSNRSEIDLLKQWKDYQRREHEAIMKHLEALMGTQSSLRDTITEIKEAAVMLRQSVVDLSRRVDKIEDKVQGN